VVSQRHEDWTLPPELYDDGGFSSGTIERPALKRLLADVEDGRVDGIVVYKVDRLTPVLPDFAKIVETFDARGEAFNTTTSMGRLPLNVDTVSGHGLKWPCRNRAEPREFLPDSQNTPALIIT
jgi:site-specific DNA recombinase